MKRKNKAPTLLLSPKSDALFPSRNTDFPPTWLSLTSQCCTSAVLGGGGGCGAGALSRKALPPRFSPWKAAEFSSGSVECNAHSTLIVSPWNYRSSQPLNDPIELESGNKGPI